MSTIDPIVVKSFLQHIPTISEKLKLTAPSPMQPNIGNAKPVSGTLGTNIDVKV